jgi:glycosyltransferase involved in cell wall biosynthesis
MTAKRLLMIAYHFPPLRGSSGIQRTLRFARHLPEFGWEPIVLTAHPRAYESLGDDLMADVPAGLHVCRAFALDTSRHLALGSRYPGALARPDRWISWWLGAVPAGLSLVRRFAPSAIWSTYPIATAHVIGHTLQRRTGLPWIADFRDPMAQEGYPADARTWASFKRVEEGAAARAARLVFTTPGAERMYVERYAHLPRERFALIENGYDEEAFASLDAPDPAPLAPGKVTILHSGIVYPDERDPSALIDALARLRDTRPDLIPRLSLRFRAAVHDKLLRTLAEQAGVASSIETLPAIGYRPALEEMLRADALLVMQASNCNDQIPAKLYEYFRARRPILALTDPAGDTAATVRNAGIDAIARLDDGAAIAALLERFLDGDAALRTTLPPRIEHDRFSRRGRAAALAALLDGVAPSTIRR